MDNQTLYEQLQVIASQGQMIADVMNQMKEEIHKLVDENHHLKIENAHLREKLDTMELSQSDVKPTKNLSLGGNHLQKLYDSGVHVCHSFYGAKREDREGICLFCESLLDKVMTDESGI